MPLKELDVRYTRRRQRPFKLSDGEGLHLLVKPNGSKLWRLKYQARQVRDRRFTLSPHRPLGRVVWHDQRRRPPRAARTCARKWGSSLAPTARCGWRGGGGVHWGGQSPAAGRIHAAIRAEGSFGAGRAGRASAAREAAGFSAQLWRAVHRDQCAPRTPGHQRAGRDRNRRGLGQRSPTPRSTRPACARHR